MYARASTRKWSWVGAVLGAALAAMAFAPSAVAATFTVNDTGDAGDANGSMGNGVCDTVAGDPVVCTLRAAISESNAAVNPDADTINFDPAVFTGNVATSTIVATGLEPVITQAVTVNGGDCDATGAFKPCAGFQGPNALPGLWVTGDNVVIRGLAITNGAPGVLVQGAANNATIAGNWFGLTLDQMANGGNHGVTLEGDTTAGDNHTVGGETPADRNVFGHNLAEGLRISGADDITIKGNYFGTKPDGTTAAPNGGFSGSDNIEVSSIGGTANPANNVMIGGTLSGPQLASPECDGPCNVIANSSDGVDLETEGGSEGSPVSTTTIRGNFIGLDRTGQTAAPNTNRGIRASQSSVMFNNPVIVGGPDPGDRNVISGNAAGGLQASGNATVRNNYFGSNSQGNAAIPNLGTAIGDATVGTNVEPTDSLVQDNRFVGNGTSGGKLTLRGGTEVVGNSFGVGTGGEALAINSPAILVTELDFNEIGGPDPGDANTVGNVTGGNPAISISGGKDNQVRGNLIGVTASGAAVPNSGPGIQIINAATDTALNNTIGGDTLEEENVISNSGGDAIEIVDNDTPTPINNSGNAVLRNRGVNNGSTAFDLFIDLRTDTMGDGPGNPTAGPNAGILPPMLNEPTTTQMTGTGTFGNQVRVFQTDAETDDDVRRFVSQATVNMTGDWTAMFVPPLSEGNCLGATQTDSMSNTSELALPSLSVGAGPCFDPAPPPPPPGVTPTAPTGLTTPAPAAPRKKCKKKRKRRGAAAAKKCKRKKRR
jgi:hypothetical protein